MSRFNNDDIIKKVGMRLGYHDQLISHVHIQVEFHDQSTDSEEESEWTVRSDWSSNDIREYELIRQIEVTADANSRLKSLKAELKAVREEIATGTKKQVEDNAPKKRKSE